MAETTKELGAVANDKVPEEDMPEEVLSWTNDDQVYSAQYFSYTPKSFSDGIYNGFIDYVKEGLTMIQDQTTTQFKKYLKPADAEEATDKLMTGMVPIAAKAFDRLEMFVSNNTFRIPDNVVLVEDEAQMEQRAALEDGKKLLEEISDLETQIINARYMNAVLRQRIRDVEACSKIRRELESMVTLVSDPSKDAGLRGAVPDSVEFVRSQITQAESTIEAIRTLESKLNSDSSDNESCHKGTGSKDYEQSNKIARHL